MIQSMTGFGKAIAEIANKKVTVEVKSVNSKQLDLMAKVCPQYRSEKWTFVSWCSARCSAARLNLS